MLNMQMQNGGYCVEREFKFPLKPKLFSPSQRKKIQKVWMRLSYLNPANPCLLSAQNRSGSLVGCVIFVSPTGCPNPEAHKMAPHVMSSQKLKSKHYSNHFSKSWSTSQKGLTTLHIKLFLLLHSLGNKKVISSIHWFYRIELSEGLVDLERDKDLPWEDF